MEAVAAIEPDERGEGAALHVDCSDPPQPDRAPAIQRAGPGQTLDLAVIGNSRVGGMIDGRGDLVWMCVPRFDGDPVFCALLDAANEAGRFSTSLEHEFTTEQNYVLNTAIVRTVKQDPAGNAIEQIDFCPCYDQFGRSFAPVGMVRIIRRLAGRPRVRVQFRPRCEYGAREPERTFGSHHIRALIPEHPLRMTTDAPVTHIVEGNAFVLEHQLCFVIGPDETLTQSASEFARHALMSTEAWWRAWVRHLALPFEWQDAVIRAAITLKLNTFEDTGGIIAALTTSIPEAPNSGRNWDYRYCWLRDAYFVVNALNKLGSTTTLERYLNYLENVLAATGDHRLQPLYSLSGHAEIIESEVPALPGFRDMGPVRNGNLAYIQAQHDVYGSAVLAVTHTFFDRRIALPDPRALFEQLEPLGEKAFELHDQPDAGIWEYRGRTDVHTFSTLMCWAACDRLGRIASHIGLIDRAAGWFEKAGRIRQVIETRAWNEKIGAFTATLDGEMLDASVLLMAELDFLPASDERLQRSVRVIAEGLRRGDFLLRYAHADDFGMPETAFVVCSFWWIQALADLGQAELARQQFEKLLARRNRFGLLSEDLDPLTGELWGNYPQTYSMVGIIMCAMRLSKPWDDAF